MRVLVDTSVWSLALRRYRNPPSSEHEQTRNELSELIREGRAELVGVVRQELLSGIRDPQQYERLRRKLRAFADVQLTIEDYEEAARGNNLCRAKGVVGSAVDFQICAVALRRNWVIFTTDRDFQGYSRYLGFPLHEPRNH